jgi:hypothetical protein
MLWLSEERNRRGRLQQPYEFGSSPRSLEARNVCNATYAALVRCMDERGLPLVWLLPEWHRGWTPRRELAKDAGMTEYFLYKAMRKTEDAVKSRMIDCGLLDNQS